MTQNKLTAESLGRIYTLAWLLTGSRGRAEAIVADSLCRISDGRVDCSTLEQTLLHTVVRSAATGPQHHDDDPALPAEIRNILALPPKSRHAFVLRFLRGMSRELSAWLLALRVDQVDEYSALAVRSLAGSPPCEKAA